MNKAPQAESYNNFSKLLHWVVALIVLGSLSGGFYMTAMDYSPLKLQIYTLHKSLGMSVLMLVAVRILWRAYKKSPKSLD